jgi:A/G-specific adenine glycosylase
MDGASERFAGTLLAWFDQYGRHDLPWQHPRTPYRVWVSEIMLQQTQVQTVVGYFERFLTTFSDLAHLAAAHEDEVLARWSGLGYYRRARHLHRAARICMAEHGGRLPETLEALAALPGIGRSTAGAILAQALGQRHAILDGNVKRLLCRLLGETGWPGQAAVERRLWAVAQSRLPHARLADYTQALMDFGATHCTPRRPRCTDCPLQGDCAAFQQGMVASLPARRPAKTAPTRQAWLLVLRDAQGRLLLEQRHGAGVWQGLWSVPEAPDADAAAALAVRLAAGRGRALPTLRHAFSHYRLEAMPFLHDVYDHEAVERMAPTRRWVHPHTFDDLGLPRPIRTLLESLP